MFVLKNRHVSKLSAANCHTKLSHSKQLPKNIHPVMLAQFRSLTKKIFTVLTLKTSKNHQLYASAAIKKEDVVTKRLRISSTFKQTPMASVGESQVAEKTPV